MPAKKDLPYYHPLTTKEVLEKVSQHIKSVKTKQLNLHITCFQKLKSSPNYHVPRLIRDTLISCPNTIKMDLYTTHYRPLELAVVQMLKAELSLRIATFTRQSKIFNQQPEGYKSTYRLILKHPFTGELMIDAVYSNIFELEAVFKSLVRKVKPVTELQKLQYEQWRDAIGWPTSKTLKDKKDQK